MGKFQPALRATRPAPEPSALWQGAQKVAKPQAPRAKFSGVASSGYFNSTPAS